MCEIIKWSSLSEELQEGFEYCEVDEESGFIVVQEGDWISQGKYEYCTNVFQRISDGKYFAQDRSRSGSYFSDYYYRDAENLYEVEKKEVIVIEWNKKGE